MTPDGLHERMRAAAGQRTNRTLSELTDTPSETVRRYMSSQAPAAEFLTLFCRSLGINGDWLLTGRGPMKASDVKFHALGEARAGDLLGAMAGSMEVLIERVDRTEKYVQTLEARVRGGKNGNGAKNGGHGDVAGIDGNGGSTSITQKTNGDEHAQTQGRAGETDEQRAAQARQRARRIADAITGRPRSDDD